MSDAARRDRCPRCGALFHCGAHDAAPCACASLTLAPELLAALRARYVGCLCLGCLRELAARAAEDMLVHAPTAPESHRRTPGELVTRSRTGPTRR